MLTSLYRHLIIPSFETGIKRRKTFRYLRELNRSQWLNRDALQQLQIERLQSLLRHAAANCPYYRRTFREYGLRPGQLHDLADFRKWPILERESIARNRKQMRAERPALALIEKATGGSSGVPLQFDLDHPGNDRRMAAWHRGYGWAGAGPGTRQLYLWGTALSNVSRRTLVKDRLYHALYRRTLLNSFELSEENVPRFCSVLNRHRPEVVVAYTNPLYDFARALDEMGLQPHQPRSIVVGAEKLYDWQRALIERVFRAPVFETYGSREFTLIGAQCERRTELHLTYENLVVEVVDEEGQPVSDGEEGRVVITDLTNYGMPFIRYANGDRAVAGFVTCNCGRGLPMLRGILGRELDLVHTPDGRRVPGEFFPHLVKDYAAIRQFQVVQTAPDQIEVRLVVRADWTEQASARFESQVRSVVGPAVRLELHLVDSIALTPAGKLRVVVNRCAPQSPLGGPRMNESSAGVR